MNNAPAVAAARGVEGQSKGTGRNSDRPPRGRQAPLVIDGERQAFDHLARLHAQRVDADELAAVVAMLRDAVSLAGFCRVIQKALGVRHG